MPDKEIIIDGVDVGGCEHINTCDNKIKCVILQDDVCETNPYCEGYNCYFKQLKRKEQECKELNSDNRYFVNKIISLELLTDKYEQALDEIERFCKDVCDSCKKFTPNRQSDISCRFCQPTQILHIINEVKEK